jgi:hypothetical protein
MAWFPPEQVRALGDSAFPEKSDSGQPLFNSKFAGRRMKHITGIAAVTLLVCSTVAQAQTGPAPIEIVPNQQEQSAPVAGIAPASDGLSDLGAMTFGCVKAGLNAAAREAAKVPSQGTYQFSYFRIINDTHHSSYEIHFKSNYQGEADLRYCVSIYCQQGWDPQNTNPSLRLMSNERQPMGVAAHGSDCGKEQAPVKRRLQ